jgi:hypothetical protein
VAIALTALSCAYAAESYSIAVRVLVTDERSQPVEAAIITLDDVHVANTDADGKAFATLQSKRARVHIGVVCPTGRRGSQPQLVVLTGRSSDPSEVTVPLSCASEPRSVGPPGGGPDSQAAAE